LAKVVTTHNITVDKVQLSFIELTFQGFDDAYRTDFAGQKLSLEVTFRNYFANDN